MSTIRKLSRPWIVVPAVVLVTLGGTLVIAVRHAAWEARRSNTYSRLYFARHVLRNYESSHGTLPPLCLRDSLGKPIHSWRALILPFLEIESLRRLDLSQPWNSDYNRKIIDSVPLSDWRCFSGEWPAEQPPATTHLLGYIGPQSIWETTTGKPKGTTQDHPGAILLICVPESDIHPLQPVDITEDEVRKIVARGGDVLFITAGEPHGYGVVTIEHGSLAFHVRPEPTD
ncbi:MAG: DUF1559 domain-containing protein [Thermoguttaceae bacterium]